MLLLLLFLLFVMNTVNRMTRVANASSVIIKAVAELVPSINSVILLEFSVPVVGIGLLLVLVVAVIKPSLVVALFAVLIEMDK